MKLIIPSDIQLQIGMFVAETELETGVTLFGEKIGEDFKLLGIAGPGPNAVHEKCSFAGNEDYATMIFEDLKKGNPNLKHLGELHAHPFGMSWLSEVDLETVKEILKEYEEFIAGVMLRGRRLKFYPVYFSRNKQEGERMEVELEGQKNSRGRFRFGRKRGR